MRNVILALLFITATSLTEVYGQAPHIASFTPTSAKPGDVVTLTGANFSSVAANNVVFFGATRATVSSASSNSVTVMVPVGATYAPIKLLNTETTLSCASLSNFNPVYSPIKNGFTSSDLDPAIVFPVTTVSNLTSSIVNNAIAISDLDGDGKPDVVVANFLENTVSVLRNTATTGTISNTSFGPKISFATNSRPIRVAIGDIDADGKPDLLVLNQTSNNISIFRNTSSGIGNINFDTKIDIASGSNPIDITISDLDGDGKFDLAVICSVSNILSIFRNTSLGIGNISFNSSIDFPLNSSARSITNGDMDGDGKPDLAVLIGVPSYKVSVFRNSSTGAGLFSFDPTVDFSSSTSNPYFMAIGDLDGDGKPELAIANSFSASVFRNTSSGAGNISYAPKIDFATSASGGRSIAIGDLDGDGKPDLVVPSSVSNVSSSLFRNSSTGIGDINFTPSNFATIKNPFAVAIADIDGDSKPDLVTANVNNTGAIATGITNETTVSVLRNADPPNPSIASFSPSSGCANSTTVIITGTNFTGTTAVSIGGTPVSSFTVNSYSQITAIVGNGTTGTVSVTTPSGSGTSSETFTVNNCNPTITTFTPSSGCVNNSTVVITGTNFTGATAVNIGGTAVNSFTVNSSSQITAIVGNGTTGAISVITPGGTATSSDVFIFNSAPVFTACSQNLTSFAEAGACSTQLSYTVAATGNPAPTLSYVFTGATSGNGSGTGSGASFNLGITNITTTATNSCGSSSCSFTITVTDNTPPSIICPSNITNPVASTDPGQTGWATATDNCTASSSIILSYTDIIQGCVLSRIWKATDASGNYTTCVQSIAIPQMSVSLGNNRYVLYGALGYTGCTNITPAITGGTAPYTYSWSSSDGLFNGHTSATINPCNTTEVTRDYTVVVTDANGCTANATVNITYINISCSNNGNNVKVKVCHIPPGNPENCNTICVSINAYQILLNNGSYVGSCLPLCAIPNMARSNDASISKYIITDELFNVKVMNNPTETFFRLYISGGDFYEKINIRVTDVSGKVIDQKTSLNIDTEIKLGENYIPGIYFAEITKGVNRKTIKLIKL